MGQAIAVVVLVALVAFTARSVVAGTWYGTWCASGMRRTGSRIPGGPHRDPGR